MEPLFLPSPSDMTCDVPRVLWIELTSTCPFDCVFCSRKTLHGAGRHMDLGLYRRIMRELRDPEVIRLNYSGESIHYPYLVEAIALAHETGAVTELVSAFASTPDRLLEPLVTSGLDRLTVSLHTMDPAQYEEIYRFGSLDDLPQKIRRFLSLRDKHARTKPWLDFAFVAMRRNLDELLRVAEFAGKCGVREIFVLPVIRRDEIPYRFDQELEGRRLRPAFQEALDAVVQQTERRYPSIRINVSATEARHQPAIGPRPRPCAGPLPPGARIHTCEQSPWDTAHILAGGDVVVCEVQDKVSMGNLHAAPLVDIWHGAKYREFRHRYLGGEDSVCRECPYKTVYKPSELQPCIEAQAGPTSQLLRGWHPPQNEDVIWSKRHSRMVLSRKTGHAALRISGVLPPGPAGSANTLELRSGGR